MFGHHGQSYLRRERHDLAGRKSTQQFGLETMPTKAFLSIVASMVVIVAMVQWIAE